MAIAKPAPRRVLKEARRNASRASSDSDAWRALADEALRSEAPEEAARAWGEVAHLREARGEYVAALRALRRQGSLGGEIVASRSRVRRRLGLAIGASVLSAVLMAAAAPGAELWPLGLVALVPLYLAVRSMAPLPAFVYGWAAGLLLNLYGFAWAVGLLGRFGHVAPAPALGIVLVTCAYQAIVFGIWTGTSAFFARRGWIPWLVAAPLVMVVAEAAVPFLFPWYLAITVWRAWPLLQIAELGGPTAVSALVVLVNLTLAEALLARARRTPLGRPVRVAALFALAVVAAGLLRAGHVAWLRGRAPSLRVGIVQPNFGVVSVEDRRQQGQRYVDVLRSQTDELGQRGAELVVWPESAFPYLFDRQLQREYAASNPWALRQTFHGMLLIGALTHTFGGSGVYNSAVLVAADGRIAGRYDKVDLMPFGEYIPLSDRFPEWAERMRGRMPDASDITPGAGAGVLESGPLRAGPMICYEDILPERGEAIGLERPRPNLLVTLANHSWFGDSLVPREALALATLRSVELRRDLVRAASTGVSSIGDALGRVRAEGALVDSTGGRHVEPERVEGQVALLGSFALGPYSAPLFPYASATGLLVLAWGRRKRRG